MGKIGEFGFGLESGSPSYWWATDFSQFFLVASLIV